MNQKLCQLDSIKEIQEFVARCGSQRAAARQLGVPRSTFQDHCKRVYKKAAEYEIKREQPTYHHKVLYQDIKRLKRKLERTKARDENAVFELNQEIMAVLSDYKFAELPYTFDFELDESSCTVGNYVGVVQCSDWHLGECVNTPNNQFNLEIASARLKLYADKIIEKMCGINTLVVALTGDLINSPRRPDEYLTNAKNSAKTFVVALDLLNQFLTYLSLRFKKVVVLSVCGNESRLDKEWGNVQQVVSNNFDYMLFHSLAALNRCNNTHFVLDDNPFETVVDINGAGILLTHGTAIKNPESDISKIVAKYSMSGIQIDYVLFGHIHSAYISDNFARSGSLVGDNTYSFNALNLIGHPSQNIFIVDDKGNIDGYKINLENVNDHFDIKNVLSENKNDKQTKINIISIKKD